MTSPAHPRGPAAPDADRPLPFTQRWADLFCAAINADPRYREASRRWTWPLALVLDPVPEYGIAEAVALDLALDRGTCLSARMVGAAETTAPFQLRGPYPVWKRIVRGELDPVAAVTFGELRLLGSLATLLMHVASARALVACAQRVPTTFPDE